MDIDTPETPSPVLPREIRPVDQDEKVLRWTFSAVPSEESQRKLHAVCILAEGSMPLRVVSPKGSVLIPEDEGLRVDPQKFTMLASLFGLG